MAGLQFSHCCASSEPELRRRCVPPKAALRDSELAALCRSSWRGALCPGQSRTWTAAGRANPWPSHASVSPNGAISFRSRERAVRRGPRLLPRTTTRELPRRGGSSCVVRADLSASSAELGVQEASSEGPEEEGWSSPDSSAGAASSDEGVQEPQESATEGSMLAERARMGGKISGNSRLRTWARARRKLGKLGTYKKPAQATSDSAATATSPSSRFDTMIERTEEEDIDFGAADSGTDSDEAEASQKEIYVISDGTGSTADSAVHAALGQFDYCFTDGRCPVNTRLYANVRDVEKLLEVLRLAGENRALVVYTLVERSMCEVARTACRVMQIPSVDMIGPLVSSVEEHLGVSAERLPRGASSRKKSLSKEYFRRIEAVDFTIKQDDGAHPRNLGKADIVLVGVSRTGKTPLSIYLAQKGYKVANVPLVPGIPPPPELFLINQNNIFALTIDPTTLESIRRTRYATLGLVPAEKQKALLQKGEALETREAAKGEEERGSLEQRIWDRRLADRSGEDVGAGRSSAKVSYYSLDAIRKELEIMHRLFRENPTWPVINVTGRAIEETAAEILDIRYERMNRKAVPFISRRY